MIQLLFIFYTYIVESPEPQQCQDSQCQEPQCQYNQQQQQHQLEQMQQLIQNAPPHVHQIHYTYSRRTSLDSNAIDV